MTNLVSLTSGVSGAKPCQPAIVCFGGVVPSTGPCVGRVPGPRTTLWPWCQVSTCRLTGASGAAAGQHTQPLRPELTQPHPRSPVPTPALPQPHPTSRWLHGRRFVRRQTISQTAFELCQVKEPEVDWSSPGGFAPGEAGRPPASDSSDYYQGILAWPGGS